MLPDVLECRSHVNLIPNPGIHSKKSSGFGTFAIGSGILAVIMMGLIYGLTA
jgi:hypothetical protein